jgi:hypothetical protein
MARRKSRSIFASRTGAHLLTPEPTEHAEQAALMTWAALLARSVSALGLLFAIPNGGARHKAVAGKLRAEGVKAGVPDLCLPVAVGPFHGLFLEMKRRRNGRLSVEQRAWAEKLRAEGYRVEECKGATAAAEVILDYLALTGRYRTP